MTLSVCQLHKRTIQSSGNKGLCCTSPSQPIWSILPVFWLIQWDEAPSAGQASLPSPASAVNLRQAIILLLTVTCHFISTSETHTHILNFSLCLVKGSASVTRYRRQSSCHCLSLSFTRRYITVPNTTPQTYRNQTNNLNLSESYSHTKQKGEKTLTIVHALRNMRR